MSLSYAEALKRSLVTRPQQNVFVLPPKMSWEGSSYNVRDVPGDGNCYFHCLSLALYGNRFHSTSLRREICGFVSENWMTIIGRIRLYHDTKMNQSRYKKCMVEGKMWPTALEIEATNRYLKR